MRHISEMSMTEARTEFSNILDHTYIGLVDINNIDAKIERLKYAMGGNVHVEVYGGNATKKEILELLEYNLICETL